jgi:NAD(P)-dependent dehydrogenase (short-subunit alcohol dehydrogenase family)
LKSKTGCDALTAAFKAKESKLHILVNNSGASWGAHFDNFPEKEGWDRIMALNVKAIFYRSCSFSPAAVALLIRFFGISSDIQVC